MASKYATKGRRQSARHVFMVCQVQAFKKCLPGNAIITGLFCLSTLSIMRILWQYLKPHQPIIFLSLLLAGVAQLLSLIDPIIFGKIIDEYASNPKNLPQSSLVRGVLFWLGIAIAVAMLARVAKAFQEYTTRLAVARVQPHGVYPRAMVPYGMVLHVSPSVVLLQRL